MTMRSFGSFVQLCCLHLPLVWMFQFVEKHDKIVTVINTVASEFYARNWKPLSYFVLRELSGARPKWITSIDYKQTVVSANSAIYFSRTGNSTHRITSINGDTRTETLRGKCLIIHGTFSLFTIHYSRKQSSIVTAIRPFVVR